MSVCELQRYLDELLAADRQFDAKVVADFKEKAGDNSTLTKHELAFLQQKVLNRHGSRFKSKASRRKLEDFLSQTAPTPRPLDDPFRRFLRYLPGLTVLLVQAIKGQVWQLIKDGRADPDTIRRVRQSASHFRGTVSLARVDPEAEKDKIEAALKKVITVIGGFDFLTRNNQHTILIKPGVNWGAFRYPTVTSWQSVYALVKLCLEEADTRGSKVKVIVGDESGIEISLWGGKTMENFQTTDILHYAVCAGLERAVSLGIDGAQAMLKQLKDEARNGWKVTADKKDKKSKEMRAMAKKADVEVVGFDFDDTPREREYTRVEVPRAKHFTDGICIPSIVAEEVTDIINLPKPPGRHLIMGNTGLSGALKNHVGLLKGSERPGLHSEIIRYPTSKAEGDYFPLNPEAHRGCGGGLKADNFPVNPEALKERDQTLQRDKSSREEIKLALEVLGKWDGFTPDLSFHQKIVELYLAVADKERFSVTDMRRTVSSLGPDLGNTIDIGAVIAAKDPLTLDVLAGALLKRAYVNIGNFFEAAMPGGETLLEYFMGKTWLKRGTPFDLISHIAANSYSVGPLDWQDIDLKGTEDSGFSAEEMGEIISYLKSD